MNTMHSRVDRVQELSILVSEFPIEVLKTFDARKIETIVDFDFAIEPVKDIVVVHLSVEVRYGLECIALNHNCIYEFLVAELGKSLDESGWLDKHALVEFVTESYALARGMIAVRTLGFGIHDFPLPFLQPEKLYQRTEEVIASKKLEATANDQQ
jgi:hypothetical protein